MSTIRMIISAKMERARLKEVPARSKSWEEATYAPANGAQGSHDRGRLVTVASRTGNSRKVGALGGAQAMFDRHAATRSRRWICMSFSALRPSVSPLGACRMIAGQYSIGIEFRRFISETVETFFPMMRANFVLPPKAAMRSAIVFMLQSTTQNMFVGQHD